MNPVEIWGSCGRVIVVNPAFVNLQFDFYWQAVNYCSLAGLTFTINGGVTIYGC